MAAAMGFVPFFMLSTLAALPAMILMLFILRYYPPEDVRQRL
jgi:hypothetical protein